MEMQRSRLVRALPAVLGIAFFLIPLFPAFITLTGAGVPGVSLLPKPLALTLLALACAIAAYFGLTLATTRGEREPTVLPLAMFPAAAAVAALLGLDARAGALFVAILAAGLMWHVVILRFFGRRTSQPRSTDRFSLPVRLLLPSPS